VNAKNAKKTRPWAVFRAGKNLTLCINFPYNRWVLQSKSRSLSFANVIYEGTSEFSGQTKKSVC